tara:strand:+ start:584 stop:712 length:129 start_codon:yes stop_codon:yes gene_type:complete
MHDGFSPSEPVVAMPGFTFPGTHRFRSSLQRWGTVCSHESPP